MRVRLLRMLLIVSVIMAPLVLAACSTSPAAKAAEPGVVAGKMAPQISLANLEGKPITIEPGQVTVINFWATWCPPCQAEMPELQKFVDTHGDVAFFAINVQDPPENAKSFMERKGYKMPVLLDDQGSVAQTYQINAIPTTLVLDRQGVIRYRKTGGVTLGELEGVIKGL